MYALVWLLALDTLATAKPQFQWDDIKYVYAFGDSYTFVEGKEGRVNFRFVLTHLWGVLLVLNWCIVSLATSLIIRSPLKSFLGIQSLPIRCGCVRVLVFEV